jgi:hypothetical protein
LCSSEIEISFRTMAYLGFLLQSSKTIPELQTAFRCIVDDGIRKIGIEANRCNFLIRYSDNNLATCNSFLNDIGKIWALTK